MIDYWKSHWIGLQIQVTRMMMMMMMTMLSSTTMNLTL